MFVIFNSHPYTHTHAHANTRTDAHAHFRPHAHTQSFTQVLSGGSGELKLVAHLYFTSEGLGQVAQKGKAKTPREECVLPSLRGRGIAINKACIETIHNGKHEGIRMNTNLEI